MGERQNGPLGLHLHLDDRFAPGFRLSGLPTRFVLPGPIGTPNWLEGVGVNRSKAHAHRHALTRSPELEQFKKSVIALQVWMREHEKPPKTPVIKLEKSELRDIPDGKSLHKNVAPLFWTMWREIQRDHQARSDASATDTIGVASGYRSAEQDAVAWEGAFPKYYRATLEKRLSTGNEFGEKSVRIFVGHMNGLKAPPGFSGHTHGIAADLTTRENGQTWTVNSSYDHQVGWQKTWLYGWLVANAWRHKFYQLKTETWHWEYHKDDPPRQCWGGKVADRPVKKQKK
jgi:hypothetical protein